MSEILPCGHPAACACDERNNCGWCAEVGMGVEHFKSACSERDKLKTMLSCGYPAACGDPCGWCEGVLDAHQLVAAVENERENLRAERDKLAAELEAARERIKALRGEKQNAQD